MTQAWVVLTGLDGRDVAAPTDTDGEARTVALRFGYDDGLMYLAEVSSARQVRFEEWSDRDCELALATPRQMAVTQAEALQLWSWLAQRQVAKIRDLGWQSGG